MTEVRYKAWVLTKEWEGRRRFFGPYWWQPPFVFPVCKALFKTRREAREAKKTGGYSDARVELVEITIRSVGS